MVVDRTRPDQRQPRCGDSLCPRRLNLAARALPLAAAALVSAALAAGCGGSSGAPAVASLGRAITSASTSATSGGAANSSLSTPAAFASQVLEFAKCMRASGVPSFPDPQPGGGFTFQPGTGVDPSSPAFSAARAKCQRFIPGGGPPGMNLGAQTNPTPQALAQMLKAARCMRRHGVSDFPDPQTSVPHHLGGVGEISDIEGVILVFPATIDRQSPLFTRAAAVCDFPLHNH
jgi:hypothetical protein